MSAFSSLTHLASACECYHTQYVPGMTKSIANSSKFAHATNQTLDSNRPYLKQAKLLVTSLKPPSTPVGGGVDQRKHCSTLMQADWVCFTALTANENGIKYKLGSNMKRRVKWPIRKKMKWAIRKQKERRVKWGIRKQKKKSEMSHKKTNKPSPMILG